MDRTELKRIFIVLAALLVCAPIVVYSTLSNNARPAASEQLRLPEVLGNWKKVNDIPFKDSVIELLGTRDVTGSVYEDPGKNVIKIIVVKAVNNRSAFHPPEYCLTGAGSEIVEKRTRVVRSVPETNGIFTVNEMVFKTSNKNSFLVWNWYSAGNSMTPNFYGQQWKLVTERIRTGSARGAVVNMYTDISNDDLAAADSLNADFVKSLLPFLNSNL